MIGLGLIVIAILLVVLISRAATLVDERALRRSLIASVRMPPVHKRQCFRLPILRERSRTAEMVGMMIHRGDWNRWRCAVRAFDIPDPR